MKTTDHSEISVDVRTEHATSLVPFRPAFPASYALPTTKEDIQRLIAHSTARPPAEIRQRLWFEAFGNEEWERRQKQAQSEYEEALEAYKTHCILVEDANQQIEADNANRMRDFAYEEARYKEKVRRFEQDHDSKRFAEKLTFAVLQSLLAAKPAIRERLSQVWEASQSRRWPYSWRKPDHVDFGLFSKRLDRYRALLGFEKGHFRFLVPPFQKRFITDIKTVRSPLSYQSLYESLDTLINSFGTNATKAIYLSHVHRLLPRPEQLKDFDSFWKALEQNVRECWEELVGIELNDDWTFKTTGQSFTTYKVAYHHPRLREYIDVNHLLPKPPKAITLTAKRPMPSRPTYQRPEMPTPPPSCYDDNIVEEQRAILQGASLANIEQNLRQAREWLFAEGTLRPYFLLGGIPFPFRAKQIRHYLCIGQSGSGKSTVLIHLMSQFLPLTRKQTKNILARSTSIEVPRPRSSHEWSRSLTFQAVVYNAKTEHVPILEAFGFNADAGPNTDLFILDPRDSRGYAWDIAADIECTTDAEAFAAMLVPIAEKGNQDDKDRIWKTQARRIITAVIVSLRNLTRKTKGRPIFNLHDVLVACSTPEMMQYVLQYHDTPNEIVSQLIDLSDAQASSIYMSATGYIAEFRTVAEQWKVAQQQGRSISIREWARSGANQLLVLPNTPDDSSFGALNRAVITALRKILLSEEFSFYRDENGVKKTKMRYIFIDEFGNAGHLEELQKLFVQGRSFGVSIVAGLTQLSDIKNTYGDETAKTIIGQFSYNAFLKTNDTETQEWMSRRFGERLEEIRKYTHTEGTSHDATKGGSVGTTSNVSDGLQLNYSENESQANSRSDGTNNGTTRTVSADPKVKSTRAIQEGVNTSTTHQDTHGTQAGIGVNRQTSHGSTQNTNFSEKHGTNKSKATTTELRKDFNIYPAEFGSFPDPETTGLIGASYQAPAFISGWRADMPFAALKPDYEREDALDITEQLKKWPNLEEVTKAKEWTKEDYERLGLEPLPERRVIVYSTQSGGKRQVAQSEKRLLLTQGETVTTQDASSTSYLDKFEFEEQ